jgi:hypothetical protein
MPDLHDRLCAICSGRVDRVALLEPRGGIEAVACSNPACVALLVRGVRAQDPYTETALTAAGRAGGARLTELGETDLRKLSREQYREVVFEIVAAWRVAMALSAAEQAAEQVGAA